GPVPEGPRQRAGQAAPPAPCHRPRASGGAVFSGLSAMVDANPVPVLKPGRLSPWLWRVHAALTPAAGRRPRQGFGSRTAGTGGPHGGITSRRMANNEDDRDERRGFHEQAG